MGIANIQDNGDIPFHKTLRTRLTFFVLVIVVLAVVSMSTLQIGYHHWVLSQEVREDLVSLGDQLATTVDRFLEEEISTLESTVSGIDFSQLLSSENETPDLASSAKQALLAELEDVLAGVKNLVDWQLVDDTATVIAAADQVNLGKTLTASSFETTVAKGVSTLFEPQGSEGSLLLIRLPLVDAQGTLLGTLHIDQDPSGLRSLLNFVNLGYEDDVIIHLCERSSDDEIRYVFSTANETVLFESLDSETNAALAIALNGESSIRQIFTENAEIPRLEISHPLSMRNWALVAEVSASAIDAPPTGFNGIVWVFGFLSLIVIGLGVFAVIQIALRPLLGVQKAADQINSGDFSPLPQPGAVSLEFAAIIQAFNHLLEKVDSNEQELEEEVQQRTSELEQSKVKLSAMVDSYKRQAELMDQDLQQAEIIQRSLLPQTPPKVDGFTFTALYVPGNSIGGDLYDVFRIDDRKLGLVVADATGHGVSAALLSVLFKNRLDLVEADSDAFQSQEAAEEGMEALQMPIKEYSAIPVFRRVNDELVSDAVGANMFVSAVLGILDTSTNQLILANAGHPPVLVIRQNGDIETIKSPGPALGLYPDAHFAEHALTLNEGDSVFMYTDGLIPPEPTQETGIEAIGAKLRDCTDQAHALNVLSHNATKDLAPDDRDDITLLWVTVQDRESRFENRFDSSDRANPEMQLSKSNPDSSRIEIAQEAGVVYLTFVGRVTWVQGKPLVKCMKETTRQQKKIVIDLSQCTYIDSAMLGTIHATAHEYSVNHLDLSIQGVPEVIQNEFVELGLFDVLGFVSNQSVPIPTDKNTLSDEDMDLAAQQRWLLRAHEALASLNTANDEEFKLVIEELREGLGQAEQTRESRKQN